MLTKRRHSTFSSILWRVPYDFARLVLDKSVNKCYESDWDSEKGITFWLVSEGFP